MATPTWDDTRQSAPYERRRQQLIADEVRGDVLDLGHAKLPNPYLDGSRVTGVDLADPVRPSGYREDLVGSVMELDEVVGSRTFDTVVAAELIEHLEEPYAFLRSIRRVLADDGRLVLSTPNPLGLPVIVLELMQSTRWFYTTEHTYYFLPRWVRRMLTDTGYRLLEIRPVGLWLPFGYVPWCPTALSYQLVYVAEAA